MSNRNKQQFKQAVQSNASGLPEAVAEPTAVPEAQEQAPMPEVNPMDAIVPVSDDATLAEDEVKLPEVTVEDSSQDAFPDYQKANDAANLAARMGNLSKEEILQSVGMTARLSLLGVLSYIEQNKKIAGTLTALSANANYVINVGPQMQVKLFRDVMDIITKTEDDEFKIAFDYLMVMFRDEADGALSYLNLSRYIENIQLNNVEQRCYSSLMRIMSLLNNPATRQQELRNIDMEQALKWGFSERARVRLLNYLKAN